MPPLLPEVCGPFLCEVKVEYIMFPRKKQMEGNSEKPSLFGKGQGAKAGTPLLMSFSSRSFSYNDDEQNQIKKIKNRTTKNKEVDADMFHKWLILECDLRTINYGALFNEKMSFEDKLCVGMS